MEKNEHKPCACQCGAQSGHQSLHYVPMPKQLAAVIITDEKMAANLYSMLSSWSTGGYPVA